MLNAAKVLQLFDFPFSSVQSVFGQCDGSNSCSSSSSSSSSSSAAFTSSPFASSAEPSPAQQSQQASQQPSQPQPHAADLTNMIAQMTAELSALADSATGSSNSSSSSASVHLSVPSDLKAIVNLAPAKTVPITQALPDYAAGMNFGASLKAPSAPTLDRFLQIESALHKVYEDKLASKWESTHTIQPWHLRFAFAVRGSESQVFKHARTGPSRRLRSRRCSRGWRCSRAATRRSSGCSATPRTRCRTS